VAGQQENMFSQLKQRVLPVIDEAKKRILTDENKHLFGEAKERVYFKGSIQWLNPPREQRSVELLTDSTKT
jgi:hypothetical protein